MNEVTVKDKEKWVRKVEVCMGFSFCQFGGSVYIFDTADTELNCTT